MALISWWWVPFFFLIVAPKGDDFNLDFTMKFSIKPRIVQIQVDYNWNNPGDFSMNIGKNIGFDKLGKKLIEIGSIWVGEALEGSHAVSQEVPIFFHQPTLTRPSCAWNPGFVFVLDGTLPGHMYLKPRFCFTRDRGFISQQATSCGLFLACLSCFLLLLCQVFCWSCWADFCSLVGRCWYCCGELVLVSLWLPLPTFPVLREVPNFKPQRWHGYVIVGVMIPLKSRLPEMPI